MLCFSSILLDCEGHIALTDFGLCKEAVFAEQRTYTFCGTFEYMAPEVVSGKGHTHVCDWWSLGVLLFLMLSGDLPFTGVTKMRLILDADFCMPDNLSAEAKSLLLALFKPDPANRLGAGPTGSEEIRSHRFLAKIDWTRLYKRELHPPFQPTDVDETYIFEKEFDSLKDSPDSTLSSCGPDLFKGFSYVNLHAENASNYKRSWVIT
jgi:p90 ribosomal S6 kinase